jgi:hypothetical protein
VRGFIEHLILSMVMLEVVCFVVVAVVCLFGSLDGLAGREYLILYLSEELHKDPKVRGRGMIMMSH